MKRKRSKSEREIYTEVGRNIYESKRVKDSEKRV
jgi:hypothetical protein